MTTIISSDSVRIDGPVLRFLVQFPDIDTGFHGVQVPLPTTAAKVKQAILEAGTKLEENRAKVALWKTNFSDVLDKPIEV